MLFDRSGSTYLRRASVATMLATLAALAACSGGGDGGTEVITPTPTITLAASPATLAVTQGQSGSATVSLARGGSYDAAVALAVSGAPAGVTVTPNPASLSGSTTSSTVTVATAASTAPGTYSLTVTASGNGVSSATTTLALTVNAASTTTPTFSLAVAPTTVNVTAGGAAATSTATIGRANGFAGAVTLAATGAPNGLTVTAPSIAAGATTSTISVGAASTTAPGTYPITITGTGAGLAGNVTQTLSVTVTAPAQTPTIGVAVSPASVSVQQGATGTATVSLTRTGGFTGAIALAVSGAPNGVAVTPNPASAAGATATLSIAASSTAAPGTYTITVAGAGSGVAPQTATFTVVVTQAPGNGGGTGGGSGNVKYTFCAPDLPIWFAYQDGTGAWTRVTGANDAYSFSIGARGGVAYVIPQGTGYDLTVVYGTAAELSTGGSAPCQAFPTGTKHLTGSVAGLGQTSGAFVSLGSGFTTVFGSPSFQLDSLPNGPLTLVATRFGLDMNTGSFGAPDKIILRRNVDYPNNSAIPTLDFGASEAFAPTIANVTIANLGADSAATGVGFYTGVFGLGFFSFNVGGATQPYAGVPSARLQSGDLHYLFVSAAPSNDDSSVRGLLTYFTNVADRGVTLGPVMATPTIGSAGSAPYPRLRAQVASQAAYGQMATVDYTQGARTANVSATAGYFGGTPATWDLAIPDLSAAGFQATWAPQAGLKTDWAVSAYGGNFFQLISGSPTVGSNYQYASKSGTLASAARSLSRAPMPSALRGTSAAGALHRLDRGRRAMRSPLR